MRTRRTMRRPERPPTWSSHRARDRGDDLVLRAQRSVPVVTPADVKILGARTRPHCEMRACGRSRIGSTSSTIGAGRRPSRRHAGACSSLRARWWFTSIWTSFPGGAAGRGLSTAGWSRLGRTRVATTALRPRPIGWDVTIRNPDLDGACSAEDRSVPRFRDRLAQER